MARYVVHVHTPKSVEEAYEYMADLRNFAEWDPGVTRAELVVGDAPGPDAAFDVDVKSIGGTLTLRYETTTWAPPTALVVRAESSMLVSLDRIEVRPGDDDGTVVTYDAELTLKGPLGLADPLVGLAFDRIGDKAAAGLIEALDGAEVADPA